MPPPPLPNPDRERFLRAVRKSGLLPAAKLDALLAAVPAKTADKVDALGEWFVDRKALTHFQVSKLKLGTFQGLSLGAYHILSPLGKGGMGTVYLARDTRKPDGRQALVALKILAPKKAKEADRMLARFLREMDLAQRVNHVHLTKTYEAGDANGVHYIAMEYIRGDSLRKRVTDHGPLTVARAARLFAEVADGLQHAHDLGLVHRDLKPANIMVTPNGHAKVLDMGLALAIDEELPEDKTIAGGQGYVVGTMDYIAPEQVDDPTQVDRRADLYALGCSIYFTLAGQPPFPGGTSIEKMKRHRKEFAEPLSDFNPTVPVEFARIVQRLMEKSPKDRYKSAAAVRDVLKPWAAGEPDKPLDVDPEQSEADLVAELEKERPATESFFESIPSALFPEKGRKKAEKAEVPLATAADEGEKKPLPIWWIAVPAALLTLCVCGGGATTVIMWLAK